MDPNEALEQFRRACAHFAATDKVEAAADALLAAGGLDTWLSSGGFLPGPWSHAPDHPPEGIEAKRYHASSSTLTASPTFLTWCGPEARYTHFEEDVVIETPVGRIYDRDVVVRFPNGGIMIVPWSVSRTFPDAIEWIDRHDG